VNEPPDNGMLLADSGEMRLVNVYFKIFVLAAVRQCVAGVATTWRASRLRRYTSLLRLAKLIIVTHFSVRSSCQAPSYKTLLLPSVAS
jgi:hypothetical protein